MSFTLTPDMKICQEIAEALWSVATSENHEISRSDSAIYRSLERALISSVRTVYRMSELRARRVRNLFAEYGPNDSLTGTNGYGIASYAEYVLFPSNRGRDFG